MDIRMLGPNVLGHPEFASLAGNGATLSVLGLPHNNSAPLIRGTNDQDKNSLRIVTILNGNINRVTLAHAKRAELAISEQQQAECGDIAAVLIQAIT